MKIEEILPLLKNVKKQSNGGYMACCSGHNDGQGPNQQSLSIIQKDGRILLHCFAGCSTAAILQPLGLTVSDLFVEKKERKTRRPASGPKFGEQIEKIYSYYDLTGKTLLYEVVRYKPKAFKQRRPDGKGGYIWNLNEVERVPYRLPQILKAIARGETIYHVEGEKDADNLVKLNLEATTSPMGAKSWKSSLAKHYSGAKEVVIFPDKDAPGRSYAKQVALDLIQVVGCVKVIELPGESVKDVSDWLESGGTLPQSLEIVKQAPVFKPPKPDEATIDYDSTNALLKKTSDDQYCILNGAFHRVTHTREGTTMEVPICNFTARIAEDILKDNGADAVRYLKLQGRLNGTMFPPVIIPESSFDAMKWVRKEWGFKARIIAGRGNLDHMVNAISCSSEKVPERTLFTHTGWREVDHKMVYLTSGGAIGAANIEVELPDRLSRYQLPQPTGDPKEAIEKSLNLLYIGELHGYPANFYSALFSSFECV